MEKNKTSYWPHMILGFLVIGVSLGYWTVKSASSIPVQESNEYMMKYQNADTNINDILEKKAAFNRKYHIAMVDAEYTKVKLKNTKRAKEEHAVVLQKGKNSFHYVIQDKNGNFVNDLNVTFLLTRPHTTKEDILVENVPNRNDKYVIDNIKIDDPGRYTLQLRAVVAPDMVGYVETPAYLRLEK